MVICGQNHSTASCTEIFIKILSVTTFETGSLLVKIFNFLLFKIADNITDRIQKSICRDRRSFGWQHTYPISKKVASLWNSPRALERLSYRKSPLILCRGSAWNWHKQIQALFRYQCDLLPSKFVRGSYRHPTIFGTIFVLLCQGVVLWSWQRSWKSALVEEIVCTRNTKHHEGWNIPPDNCRGYKFELGSIISLGVSLQICSVYWFLDLLHF